MDNGRDVSHRWTLWVILLFGGGMLELLLSSLPSRTIDAALAALQPKAMSAPIDTNGALVVREVLQQREPDSGSMAYASLDSRKLGRLMRAMGIVLVLNGITVILRSRGLPAWTTVPVFPFAVATSLVLLIAAFRLATDAGVGFGGPRTGPKVASGIILNEVDNLSYASWAAQAREGRWRFKVLYTTEAHQAAYVNPFFLAIGWAARVLDWPVLAVLHIGGLAAAFVTVVCVYFITLLAGLPPSAARWATFLAAFSSGLSILMTVLHLATGIPLFLGVDVIYLEAILFTTFCCWPYQSCMLGMLAACIVCLMVCERGAGRGRRTCRIALPVLAFLLAAAHPYEGLALCGSYSLFTGISLASTPGRAMGKQRVVLVALLGVGVLPAILYGAWVSRQDVWSSFAHVCLSEWRPRWAWIVGYGLILPLGIAQAVHCLRAGLARLICWPAVWTLLVVVLLVGVNVPQTTKLCNGGHLPMCIMAGAACAAVVRRIAQIRCPVPRAAARFAGCCAVVMMISGFLGMMLYGFRPHVYDRDLQDVAREIKQGSRVPLPAVLCDVWTARILSVLVPAHVYAGHYALTPHYQAKHAELIRAGLQVGAPGETGRRADPLAWDGLLQKARVDFVVLRQDVPARPWADGAPRLRFLHQFGVWRLYQVASRATTRPLAGEGG